MSQADYVWQQSAVFDRDAPTRQSLALLDAAWVEPGAQLLIVREGEIPLCDVSGAPARIAFTKPSGARTAAYMYIGRLHGVAYFSLQFPAPAESAAGLNSSAAERFVLEHTTWQPFIAVGYQLSAADREIATTALALANWHKSASFSPRDGSETEVVLGGWGRVDTHGAEHFPRTDPAVIVLVEHDSKILLGSNVLWETGRFSLLAGFIEAGESAEQAVVREVQEEAGIIVTDVEYVSSQPWPFPRSLMLGFSAKLAPGANPHALVADPTEISELRWFSRADLADVNTGVLLPGQTSIAGQMIHSWLVAGVS